ncbi:MAG: NUDIX domain-containing protein [Candidatus Competibacterales bacterium]
MNYRVEVLERHGAHRGYFAIDRYRLRFELYGGGYSEPLWRECFERGRAVAVLPFDPVADRVVLVEQFRVGALASGAARPWLWEVVAGIVEPGESDIEVAHRESLEEAGLALFDLAPIGQYYVSPGGSSERVSLFCARVDAASGVALGGVAGENEDIRVLAVDRREAMAWLDRGEICVAPAVIALQWLALHRLELLDRWGLVRG